MSSCSFRSNVIHELFFKESYIFNTYMYKHDLALNNLQGLIYRKTQPTNQTTRKCLEKV